MIGPLHLLVIGFDEDKRARDITRIVKGLKRAQAIRLFDLLYIIKHNDGKIETKEISELRRDEKREYGTLVRRLIGLATQDVEQMGAAELADSLAVAEDEFGLSESEFQAIADRMPNGSSGILAIFEHTWARGLKEDIQRAGGAVRAQGLIDPATLEAAADELSVILDAINRAESSAMDQLVEVKVGTEADAEAARAAAAETIAASEADSEAARLQAVEAVAAAQAREEEAQGAIAAAEQREKEAAQAVAEAQAHEEEARQHAAQASAKAQEMEDAAFAEAEVVRRAAERQQQRAMAEAAAVEKQAQEIEATAVLRAMNALIRARVIEQKAARHALDTIIAADVVEAAAVQEAAKALTSG